MGAVIVVLIVLIIFLLLVIWMIYTMISQRNVPIQCFRILPWPQQESASRIVERITPVMQRWRYRLTSQGPVAIVFSYSYRPLWLTIPCVLFFPIGLLSLLYKRTADISFNLVPSAEGTNVSVTGIGPRPVIAYVDELLTKLEESETLQQ